MIGVIGLDTTYTKIPGHIRNPATFGFPVVCKVVRGATAERVVRDADPALLRPFIDAARSLEAEGAVAITSACGFLALFQRELAASVSVPLYASSLIQLPMVHRMLRPDQSVAILTASASALTPRHLAGVGAESVPVRVAGLDGQPEFRSVILEARRSSLDADRLREEVLAVAGQLLSRHDDIGALLIECTDLVPFAHAIQARFPGLPIFDIVTLTEMVHRTLTRHPYPDP
jgi:hypothetical protein